MLYKASPSARERKNNTKRSNKNAWPAGGNKVYINNMSNTTEEYFEHAQWAYFPLAVVT